MGFLGVFFSLAGAAAISKYNSSFHLSSFEMTEEDKCVKFTHNGKYYDRNAFILENAERFKKLNPLSVEEMKAKAAAERDQGTDVELNQAVFEACEVALGNIEPFHYA